MSEIAARTFKGTRDFLPEDMRIREKIINTLKSVFTLFGFAPLETPAVEFLEILAGKYGEDADKLLYPLAYKGGRELALRYDLTVPLARVVAMNPHLPKPFKRYQIQPVWRADSPQLKRGRYREFYQCDVDTVGSSEPIADAEIIALMANAFDALNFKSCEVRLNSRKVLNGIIRGAGLPREEEPDICRIIDKLEKEGLERVQEELLEKYEADSPGIKNLCDLLEKRVTGHEGMQLIENNVPETDIFRQGLDELHTIFALLDEMMVPEGKVVFDFTLARGLDYYTGPIFEVILPERPDVGSLAGGGRYDDLVGLFLKDSIPATGTSFGMERIHTLLKQELEKGKNTHCDIDFLVLYFAEETRPDSLRLVRELRNEGIRSEMYFSPDKMKKQFGYADKKNIPYVAIIGPEEKENNAVKVKHMNSGTQEMIARSDFCSVAKRLLENH